MFLPSVLDVPEKARIPLVVGIAAALIGTLLVIRDGRKESEKPEPVEILDAAESPVRELEGVTVQRGENIVQSEPASFWKRGTGRFVVEVAARSRALRGPDRVRVRIVRPRRELDGARSGG